MKLWDAESGSELRTWPRTGLVKALAFSLQGEKVLVGTERKLTLWERETGELIRTWTHSILEEGLPTSITAVAYSPEGRWILSGNDYTAKLWDTESGTEIRVFPHLYLSNVAFSADGQHVLTGGWDGTVRIWDIRDLGPSQVAGALEYK